MNEHVHNSKLLGITTVTLAVVVGWFALVGGWLMILLIQELQSAEAHIEALNHRVHVLETHLDIRKELEKR